MDTTLAASSVESVPSSYTERSLAVASLDIGRMLADRSGVLFHGKGTCMYPTIRPGDVLSIQSRPAVDFSVGDIAVFRRSNAYLFCHRVIYKGHREGRAFIVTRSDRSRHAMDEPTFDENLLGVVVSITRNGKPAPLQPTVYPLPVHGYYLMRLALIHTARRLQLWLTAVLGRLVQTGSYRLIARTMFALARSRLRYIVDVPLNATLGDGVHRRFDPDTFDLRMEWKGKRIDLWTLVIHLNDAREPVARVTFVRSADAVDAWLVSESHVNIRYSGVGLDGELIGKAETILARSSQRLRPLKSGSFPSGTS